MRLSAVQLIHRSTDDINNDSNRRKSQRSMIQTHLHQGALIRLRWRVINRLDIPEWSCYKWALSRLFSTSKWVFSLHCPHPARASAPAQNNKWLLLTVLLVMMPGNKQKSINNNLLRKNEPLNKTDTRLGCGKWHLKSCRKKKGKWLLLGYNQRGDARSHPVNEKSGCYKRVIPMQERNVICRLQLTPPKIPHQILYKWA